MRQQRARLVALVTVATATLIAQPVIAQRITGDITGTVTDAEGAAVPGASVVAQCVPTGLTRTVQTAGAGSYSIAELPICVYKVAVKMKGFATMTRDVQVAVGSISKADFKLKIGDLSEEVTVEAVAPLVEFSDKLNNYVDKERIDNLPLSGRDFNSLLGITPGVQRAAGGGFLAVTISGARRTANNYMVDGIPNNDRYYGDSVLNQTGVVGIPATLVPMDAIAEFTVQQTPGAEFGVKGGAAINVVMKSGTNDFHGSSHYFRHDEWTDAANYFAKANGPEGCSESDRASCGKRTPLQNQQFGFTFGGPIVKDKTFFFAYYEGQRLSTENPYEANVPTPGQIAEARSRIAAAGLSPNRAGEALLRFYPTSPSGVLSVNNPSVADMDTVSLKLDHRLNSKNQLSGRVFYGDSFQSAPAFVGTLNPPADVGAADMFNSVAPSKVALAGVIWTLNPSASSILETRFGYSRFSQTIDINNDIDPRSLGIDTGPLEAEDFGVPAVYYLGPFGYIGGVGGYPITTAPNATLDVSSALTWSRGKHSLKVGGNVQRATTNSLRNRARTVLDFSGGTGEAVDSLVALLLGRADDAFRSFGSTRRHLLQDSLGLFVSDEWKLDPRFTVSLGLRYDISKALGEEDDLGANFLPDRGFVHLGTDVESLHDTDKNNFGPRAGFSWDVTGNGRTAIRGGYALTYDIANFGSIHAPRTQFSGLGARAGAFTQPAQGIFSVVLVGDLGVAPDDPDATCVDPATGDGNFVCIGRGPIYGSNPNGSPPFNAFSVPQDFQTPMYNFFHLTFQHEVFRNNVFTLSYVGNRGRDLLMYRDINGPPLGGGPRPLASRFPDLRHVIQITNDGRSWYDSAQLSWRQREWKGINTQYNLTWSRCRDYVSINRGSRTNFPQANNPYGPEGNEGPCDHDVPLNFNAGGTYEVPSIPGIGRFGKGWQFGTVFTALDGRPFTPNIGSRDRSGQDIAAIRADCNATIEYNPRDPNNYIANAAAAFSEPAPGRLGTCGRNVGRLPGLTQWDLSLLKDHKITEKVNLQFRWEVFNILNRANFGGLTTTNVRSGAFGSISSTPDVDAVNPVISQGGPRSMQWAVKVIF